MDAFSGRLGTVVVVSRLRMVVQTIGAALRDHGLAVEEVHWVPDRLPDLTGADDARVVVLVDELSNVGEIHESRLLVSSTTLPVLVLTSRAPGPAWGAMLTRRHVSVVSSRATLDDVTEALRGLVAGEISPSPHKRRELIAQWADWVAEASQFHARLNQLSPRERLVLELMDRGSRVPDIAEELAVAPGTVRSQVKSLRRKLGVGSQLAAVAALNRFGEETPVVNGDVEVPRPRAPGTAHGRGNLDA